MRPRRVLIILTVLVLTGAGVATLLTSREGPFSAGPPRLALAAEPAHARSNTTPPPSPTASAGGWQVTLAGPLPTGGPDHGPVWTLPGGPVDLAQVRTLAAALGMGEQPVRVAGAWQVKGRGVLEVRDDPGRPWSFSAAYAPGPPPIERDAHLAATAVLIATGVRGTTGPITSSGPYLTLTTDPAGNGLPTAGWSTQVTVGPGGTVANAHGWLARPRRGAEYRLISAGKAFDELRRRFGHRPGLQERECPSVEAEGSLPCAPKVTLVTGAHPGLSLTYNRDAPMLAPSWLFTTTTPGRLIPQVAIEPAQLSTPAP